MTTTTTTAKSRNIRLTLYFTVFAFCGRSIWSQSVLATYVYLIANHRPDAVGFLTATMGLAQLLASLPTGYLADRYRRDTLLKVALLAGLFATVVTLTALYAPTNDDKWCYVLLVVALAVWGVFWGIANTALGALFADSIPNGQRSKYFTQRSILINLGNTVGPSLALGLFFALGDHWTTRDCAIVMTLGQVVCLPAVMMLSCFSDDDIAAVTDTIDEDQQAEVSLREPLIQTESDAEEESSSSASERIQHHTPQSQQSTTRFFGCISSKRLTPVLISIADLTSGLASGMSIRYFPIFFLDRLHLSPVQVQVLYIVAPLLQACLMKSGQYFSKQYGRCQLTILHKWMGISAMSLLIILSHFDAARWMVCVVYALRTAFMNSTSPLTKSMLMDAVPTQERGRWSALESVNMFSWSGSAFLGGILVRWNGLLFNFSVTATLQFLATMPIVVLMLIGNTTEERDDGSANNDQRDNDDTLISEEQHQRDYLPAEAASTMTASVNSNDQA